MKEKSFISDYNKMETAQLNFSKDINFGFFQDKGVSKTNRMYLFYGVCIWIRLGLAYLAYRIRNEMWFPYVVILGGILSAYLNLSKLGYNVWWSRTIHGINAVLITLSGLLMAVRLGTIPNETVAGLMMGDVLFGFGWSLWKQPF